MRSFPREVCIPPVKSIDFMPVMCPRVWISDAPYFSRPNEDSMAESVGRQLHHRHGVISSH